ncbi:MAG: Ni/Fe-hydrogenase cytochrome b subunit [bacterium]
MNAHAGVPGHPKRWWIPGGITEPHPAPRPVGGPYFTGPVLALLALAAVAGALIVWRFAVGLGASTALNDGYPWGLWIAFDVVTGTALACGGYAVALLTYTLNRGQYHPLVRPAMVTSAFGYTIAGLSVVLDVGRPWLIWKVPLFVGHWNENSVLLEVALCIMGYVFVVWLELAPAFLERARDSAVPAMRAIGRFGLPVIQKALLYIVALGVLLPTMHQSSLGALLLISGPRLHALWNTPMLPLLFLISCIAMGFGAVVLESGLSSWLLGRKPEREMLAGLGLAMVPIVGVYLAIRLVDLAVRGQLAALVAFDTASVLSLVEMALFALGIALLATRRRREDLGNLIRAAMVLIFAGALYRFDVFLVAFNPGAQWHYFPNVAEILITAGLVAGEIAGYLLLIRFFPILSGRRNPVPAS